MAYDKREQLGRFPNNIGENHDVIGDLKCFRVEENSYCDWCEQNHKKDNLWYSLATDTWFCEWCRKIREMEIKIYNIAQERNEVNNYRGYVMDYYPYSSK